MCGNFYTHLNALIAKEVKRSICTFSSNTQKLTPILQRSVNVFLMTELLCIEIQNTYLLLMVHRILINIIIMYVEINELKLLEIFTRRKEI